MKLKNLTVILAFTASLTAGCTAPTLTVDGKTYPDYGLLNYAQNYDPDVQYEPNW